MAYYLTTFEGNGGGGAELTAADRAAMQDKSITLAIGIMYYYNNPAELAALLKERGVEIPESLGVLPLIIGAIASFAAPIIGAGLGTLFEVKGQEAIQDGQAKVYAEQLKIIQAQADAAEKTAASQEKMLNKVLIFAGAGLLAFLLLK